MQDSWSADVITNQFDASIACSVTRTLSTLANCRDQSTEAMLLLSLQMENAFLDEAEVRRLVKRCPEEVTRQIRLKQTNACFLCESDIPPNKRHSWAHAEMSIEHNLTNLLHVGDDFSAYLFA
mmetsp:Transcript_33151/g.54782  ORF Transcript_33151/g.54782 Transcript_33151/m.54782 type:complete len:123 (+) Transcript_33151:298-666(+)